METKNYLRFQKSKNIVFNGIGCELIANFKLADDCNNGICEFSVTGQIVTLKKELYYKKGEALVAGAIAEKIAKYMPEYKPICDIHLKSFDGCPMYPVENGIYLVKRNKENAMGYLDINEEEYVKLSKAVDDKDYFAYLLFSLGIVARWKEKANEAITLMEKECGYKWENPYPDKKGIGDYNTKLVETLIAEGYYDDKAIEDRREKARIERIEKRKEEILARYKKKVREAEVEMNIDLVMADWEIDKYIYYPNRNEVVFNWLEYKDEVSEELFDKFKREADLSKFPEGCTFKLKEDKK